MKVSPSLAAVADQAANSGITFACALGLMYFGTPSSFATFGLLSTYLALVSGLQTSMLGSPIQVIAGRQGADPRAHLIRTVGAYQAVGTLALAVLAALLCIFLSSVNVSSLATASAISACVLAYWLRDFQRTSNIALGESGRLLFNSLASFVGVVTLISWYVLAFGNLTLVAVCVALTVPQAIILFPLFVQSARSYRSIPSGTFGGLFRQLAPLSQWAVLGGVLAWIQNQVHLTLAALFAGVGAVAALAASRLIVSPALSAATGLNRLNLTRFGASWRDGGRRSLHLRLRSAMRAVVILHFVAGGFLVGAWQFDLDVLLPSDYRNLWDLIFLWFGFSLLVGVRGCVTAALQVVDGFRWMFKMSAVACVFSLSMAMGGYMLFRSINYLVVGPLITEICVLWVAWRRLELKSAATAVTRPVAS